LEHELTFVTWLDVPLIGHGPKVSWLILKPHEVLATDNDFRVHLYRAASYDFPLGHSATQFRAALLHLSGVHALGIPVRCPFYICDHVRQSLAGIAGGFGRMLPCGVVGD